MSKKKENIGVEAESILVSEYEYIAQTAFQANEDRARVTTFYLVSVGSLVGAIYSTNPSTDNATLWAFAALFLFLTYFGFLTLNQLIRLRYAWFESIRAMNQIKDVLIQEKPKLKQAFRWTNKSLPKSYKRNSVAYFLALQITTLSAVTSGATFFYIGLALLNTESNNLLLLLSALFFSLLSFIFQKHFYKKKLQ